MSLCGEAHVRRLADREVFRLLSVRIMTLAPWNSIVDIKLRRTSLTVRSFTFSVKP